MRVLVTGGTGFLGRRVVGRLKQMGHEVRALGRNPAIGAQLTQRGIEFLQADLAEGDRVREACQGQEMVIHCGAAASPWGSYELFYRANVLGTRNVVNACRSQGVGRLIHVSTPSVYFSYHDRLMIKESDPLPRPVNAYAKTKRMADDLVDAAFLNGLATVSIRPRAVFGPGDQAVLPRLIRVAQQGSVPLVGGGRSFVDMTYVENVVDALVLCLEAPPGVMGNKYNITNGEPVPVRSMMETLFSKLNLDVSYRALPFAVAYPVAASLEAFYRLFRKDSEPPLTRYSVGLMAKSQTLDIQAARSELGYEPKISLEEGFSRFAHWWKAKISGKLPPDDLGLDML
jgi:nucleoside-diphosphate-sugar epimerase